MTQDHTATKCTREVSCAARKKVVLIPFVLSKDKCGVDDSALLDFMVWDLKTSGGKSCVTFRFCPWCGEPWNFQGKFYDIDELKPQQEEPGDHDGISDDGK